MATKTMTIPTGIGFGNRFCVTSFLPSSLNFAFAKTARHRRRIIVSNSVDTNSDPTASTSSTSINTSDFKSESETSSSSMQAPGSFSSLITASNIRRTLQGIEVVSVDHYARLGIPRGCSYDEVCDAFKRKCEELGQQDLDEDKVQSKLRDLKESYEIMSSEEERRFYDWSLARAENKDRYVWPYESDITQRSSAPGPPKEEEDTWPTILTGYFFLGWFLLAFVLSFTLK